MEKFFILAIFCIIMAPWFFFLATQHTVLQSLDPQARTMHPAMVWLQVIPVFGQIWQFIVVYRIADSFRREMELLLAGSFLGADDFREAITLGKRPTLGKGNTFGILNCVILIMILLTALYPDRIGGALSAPLFILGVVTIVCFITYWSRLAAVRRLIARYVR
jgi:hypothetical protein